MSQRRALVIDRDLAFVEFVRRSLGPYGFEVEAADGVEGLGKRLKPRPALAFIGVDLPDRAGFELFSRTRAIVKGLPIILVTASVPPNDMAMHQKLSIHADGYLDKRGLGEAQFIGAIDRLIKLGPRIHGSEGRAVPPNAGVAVTPDPPEDGKASAPAEVVTALRAAGLDPNDSAAIAALLTEPVAASAPAAQKQVTPPASPAEAKLLARIAGLERQLQAARDTARGSPFSREFLDLREQVERQEREIVQLKEAASGRVARAEGAERRLRELARALLKAGEKSELAARATQQAEQARDQAASEAEEARAALAKNTQEQSAEAATLRAQHAAAVESLEAEVRRGQDALAREQKERAEWAEHAQASLTAAEGRHATELSLVRERHALELEEQRRLQAGLAKRLEEATRSLTANESERKTELEEARAALDRKTEEEGAQLTALRKQHAAAIASLQTEIRHGQESLARGERERADWAAHGQASLAAAEERHASELARARERHAAELQEQRTVQAGLVKQIEEATRSVATSDAERKTELSALRQEHAAALSALETRYLLALSEADKLHATQLARLDHELTAAQSEIERLHRELSTRGPLAPKDGATPDELAAAQQQIEELRRELGAREQRAREDEETISSLRELIGDFSGGLQPHREEPK